MRLASISLLLVGLASFAHAAPPDRSTIKKMEAFGVKWWKARPRNKFYRWSENDRAALLKQADEFGAIPEGSLAAVRDALWKSLKKYGPKGKGRGKVEIDSPYKQKMWYYGPTARGKNKGLLVGLHGGGAGAGSADGPKGTWQMKGCLGVYPQGLVIVGDNWNTVQGEKQILTMIEHAKAQNDIDPDRVYVVGFSMGGTGSWHMAGRWPDWFAGAAPCAGVVMAQPKSQLAKKEEVASVQYGLIPNVRNLAVYSFIGLNDVNCMPGTFLFVEDMINELKEEDPEGYSKFYFKTYPGLAHAFPPGEPSKCVASLREQKRDTFPGKIVWQYAAQPYPRPVAEDRSRDRLQKHYMYWLHHAKPADRMEIVAVRKGNEFSIEIVGGDAEGLSVLLNDRMIDVSKEVVVKVDGEEIYRGMPEPNFRTVVETLDAKLDRSMLFDRRVPCWK